MTNAKWAGLIATSPDAARRDLSALIKQGILVKNDTGGPGGGYSWALRDSW